MPTTKPRHGARNAFAEPERFRLTQSQRKEIREWAGKQPEQFYADIEQTITACLYKVRILSTLPTPGEFRAALKELQTLAERFLQTVRETDDFTRQDIRRILVACGWDISVKSDPIDVAARCVTEMLGAIVTAQKATRGVRRSGGRPQRKTLRTRMETALRQAMNPYISPEKIDGGIELLWSYTTSAVSIRS